MILIAKEWVQISERSVLSYFETSSEAMSARNELIDLGIEVVQVDQFGHVPGSELTEELHNPMTGEYTSNASLVEGSALDDDSARLLGSDPAVSGMAGTDHVRGRSFILTAVTDDEHVDQAVQVIKKHKGYV